MTTEATTVIVMNVAKGKRALRPLEEISVKMEPVDVDMELDGSLDMFAEKQHGRKRQRLDHLSTEEKVMRRKMKNRVAAQSARDRKKALMDDLEDKVRHLETKLASYEKQNRELIAQNENLCKRNEELMKRLEFESKVSKTIIGPVEPSSAVAGHCAKALGHASSINVSQPKKQACPLVTALLMMHYVGSMILKQTNCSTPYKTSSPPIAMNPHRQAVLEKVLLMFQSAAVRKMVGTAAECVESIKELIRFDHVYYKSEVEDHETMSPCAVERTQQQDPSSKTPGLETIFAAEDEGMLESDWDGVKSPFSRVATDMSDCDISENEKWDCKSESGYDSPCSAGSVADDGHCLWEESFVELFPSLA